MRLLAKLAFAAFAIVATRYTFMTAVAAMCSFGALVAIRDGCTCPPVAEFPCLTIGVAATLETRVAVLAAAGGAFRALLTRIGRTAATAGNCAHRAPAIAVAVMLLDRDARRSRSKGRKGLAVRIRIARHATDRRRAKHVATDCCRASASVTTRSRIWSTEVVSRLAHIGAIDAGATVANLTARTVLVDTALVAAFTPAALLIGGTIGVRATSRAAPLLATAVVATIERVTAMLGDNALPEAARLTILAVRLARAAHTCCARTVALDELACAALAVLAFAAFLIGATARTDVAAWATLRSLRACVA
jgi:hypothetical protein